MNEFCIENIDNKILKSLFVSPKTFEQLIKDVKISRPTLTQKLNYLKEKGDIEKIGPRYGGKYQLKKQIFDKISLYPEIFAALLSSVIWEKWMEKYAVLFDKIDNTLDSKKIEDINKTRANWEAEYLKITQDSIQQLELTVGNLILKSLVFQYETNLPILKTIEKLIHFMYIEFIKHNLVFQSVYKKHEDYPMVKKMFSVPYDDIEKEFLNIMARDIEYTNIIKKVYGDESTISKSLDDFYRELGFPFNGIYKMRTDRDIFK